MLVSLIVILCVVSCASAFNMPSSFVVQRNVRVGLKMEYIPEGLSKAQWAAIKKKEVDAALAKKNGALGGSKFKSRSFEAWHKSGAKHLFPVDPNNTAYEERPYMQRKDGDWEGGDLAKKGLVGKSQGTASKRLKLDDSYEKRKKAGELDSVSIFGGASLPWTNAAADKVGKAGADKRGVAGKKLSDIEMKRLKANLAKVSVTQKEEKEKPKKKGLFGF